MTAAGRLSSQSLDSFQRASLFFPEKILSQLPDAAQFLPLSIQILAERLWACRLADKVTET